MPSGTQSDPNRAALRIAGLTLINALVFQEQLSRANPRVRTLAQLQSRRPLRSALADHWDFIIREIDYVPIFELGLKILNALPSSPDVERALGRAIETAQQVLAQQAALRHDLMGRVYHTLLAEAKHLGTYYTSVAAATLLLKLALNPKLWPKVAWDSLEHIARLRIGDLACGTGTLLMAAVQAITDNHVLSRAARGERSQMKALHRLLVERVVWGYDVLASAVHLTASTIAMLSPEVVFRQMCMFVLPLGGQQSSLGSIEFLETPSVRVGGYLFGPPPRVVRVTGTGSTDQVGLPKGGFDLVTMNPPFTRSVGGNLLFGSRPAPERKRMQKKLSKLLKATGARADATAGLGSVFVAVCDRRWVLKPGGRLALVLPKTLLTGVAWSETRSLFADSYTVEYVVVSHEPGRWNFSENTDLSEVLLVARKSRNGEKGAADGSETYWVNLTRNPRNVTEALALAHTIYGTDPVPFAGKGITRLRSNGQEWGEMFRIQWKKLKDSPWFLGSFASTELNRLAFQLVMERRILGQDVPIARFGDLFAVGPDCRDVHDGFTLGRNATSYPAVWDHDSTVVKTMAASPNVYLVPRHKAAPGRPLRDPGLLWGRAGRLLVAERLWLNTTRVAARRTGKPVLANVWWPCRPKTGVDSAHEKAICLWLNSTPGLIVLLAHRTETRGAWIKLKKPALENMPVPDVRKLRAGALLDLARSFDLLKDRELSPLPRMADDPIRAELDRVVEEALELPSLQAIRDLLAQEPVIRLMRRQSQTA